jgi:hypothetical protein
MNTLFSDALTSFRTGRQALNLPLLSYETHAALAIFHRRFTINPQKNPVK